MAPHPAPHPSAAPPSARRPAGLLRAVAIAAIVGSVLLVAWVAFVATLLSFGTLG